MKKNKLKSDLKDTHARVCYEIRTINTSLPLEIRRAKYLRKNALEKEYQKIENELINLRKELKEKKASIAKA